jgi:hypothetical protein
VKVLFLSLWELKLCQQPPALLRLNHGQNQNQSGCVLAAKAKGKLRAGGNGDGDKGKIFFKNCSKMGVHKATGHGADGDC